MTATIHAFPAHIDAIRTARDVLHGYLDHGAPYPRAVIEDARIALDQWSWDAADRRLVQQAHRQVESDAVIGIADEWLYGTPAPRSCFTLDSLNFWASTIFAACAGGCLIGAMLWVFVQGWK